MLDDEFYELTEVDTEAVILPAFTALLIRKGMVVETLWVHGYPGVRQVLVTMPRTRELPGLVRELPVGWRDMRDAEAFRAFCERIVHSYLSLGWERREAGVRTDG